MSWQSKLKTVAKYSSPVIYAGDFVKDVVDPRTDVLSGVDLPFNNGRAPAQVPQRADERPQNSPGEVPPSPNSVMGASTVRGDANDVAALDVQEGLLRDMLGRSRSTLDQGLTGLSDSYNREVGNANQQRGRALEDFSMKREDTTRAKQNALGRVDTNARVLNNSLRQMIGQASGNSSSAYQYAAPNAVARQASGERTDVLGNYGENERNISLAERRTSEDFASLLEDLARQRSEREHELRGGILESEQGTNAQLAELAARRAQLRGGDPRAAAQPYQGAINERQAQLDSLFERFRNPTLSARPVEVQAPQLRDYMVDRAAIQGGGAQPGQYSPYSQFLRPRDEEEQLY